MPLALGPCDAAHRSKPCLALVFVLRAVLCRAVLCPSDPRAVSVVAPSAHARCCRPISSHLISSAIGKHAGTVQYCAAQILSVPVACSARRPLPLPPEPRCAALRCAALLLFRDVTMRAMPPPPIQKRHGCGTARPHHCGPASATTTTTTVDDVGGRRRQNLALALPPPPLSTAPPQPGRACKGGPI